MSAPPLVADPHFSSWFGSSSFPRARALSKSSLLPKAINRYRRLTRLAQNAQVRIPPSGNRKYLGRTHVNNYCLERREKIDRKQRVQPSVFASRVSSGSGDPRPTQPAAQNKGCAFQHHRSLLPLGLAPLFTEHLIGRDARTKAEQKRTRRKRWNWEK